MNASSERRSIRLRFGDDLEVVHDPSPAPAGAPDVAAAVHEHQRRADQDAYLVVQRGTDFQQEFEDVELLRRDGQFDLVLVPTGQDVPELGERYTARRLVPSEQVQVVYRVVESSAVQPDRWVKDQLDKVTPECIGDQVATLARLGTRLSWSDGYRRAVRTVKDAMQGLGAAVSQEPFDVVVTETGGPQTLGRSENLIFDWLPDRAKRAYLTAHLDSLNAAAPHDVTARAPGANDNASGVAALICLGRVLGGLLQSGEVTSDFGLRLVFFGAEEQQRSGSVFHVRELGADGLANVHIVLNLDMVAYPGPDAAEPVKIARVCGNRPAVRRRVAELGSSYTGLTVEHSSALVPSDHLSFRGRFAVCSTHKSDYDCCYHSDKDLPDELDLDLAVKIARMNLAYLLTDIVRRVP